MQYLTLRFLVCLGLICLSHLSVSQIVLMGENPPFSNVNDGDFNAVRGYWRQAKQSPFWTTRVIEGEQLMGIHYGTLFSSNSVGVAESGQLNNNPKYQKMRVGDIWQWQFGADLEYVSEGTMTVSLVFGEHERILSDKVELVGSDKNVEHFSGIYTLTDEDVAAGFPFVRVTFYSGQDIKVYLHYVNICVTAPTYAGPESLMTATALEGISLRWSDALAATESRFYVYRNSGRKSKYQRIATVKGRQYLDHDIVSGRTYDYLVTRQMGEQESGASPLAQSRKIDDVSPNPPLGLTAEAFDTEVKLRWDRSSEADVDFYTIERRAQSENDWECITDHVLQNQYEDLRPPKGQKLSYVVYAHDYSGNKSRGSEPVLTQVKAVEGASFIDLIRPMSIHTELREDLWGGDEVLPRDPDNGIEHPDWSYWGGHPIKDQDGKYHMLVVRWPEDGLKGHWEWPNSTVVHSVSHEPEGPYVPTKGVAYAYKEGLGHNADVIRLNDGSYLLYALIDWEPTLFTSESMSGPWKREGVMQIDYDTAYWDDDRGYQVERNLSGVQLEDGSMLFVTKFGRMIKSTEGLLGPYKVLTDVIQKNESIPERYRHSNYEDPVMWRDEVQFHLLINAFLDKRAIYLRSPDGIRWTFDPGLAYDPEVTRYVDGTDTHWYKLERPHVIQDSYGRATHLSLAALDVPKADDLSNDLHNSKNLIIPLRTHCRLDLISPNVLDAKKIKVLIRDESSFEAMEYVDIASLRFGASSEVNYGRGAKALKYEKVKEGLLVTFDGMRHGLTVEDFTAKLIGKSNSGELILGFIRLPSSR
ncbi:hypothetical protein [Reichenbachiella sp. MSK19-1]|uniref:hypothetical protein n=1 Tax=Reichenbachiella sp. MSK19-1 TaxID=1897631 RepID=UPI000EC06307|nr:hypothetical protein [Reichenbachiella sp. MSK19-1]RJE72526.1 hypothetical protein BGP76_00695 [Reichenbachiella sp. MSK19-1]